jgi:uroporphyrinogen decarboxylase
MTSREKFLQIANGSLTGSVFAAFDLNVNTFMDETLDRWYEQGLSRDVDLIEHFGFDRVEFISAGPYDPVPSFEEYVISEDETTQIMQNAKGATVKIMKAHAKSTMPQWLEYPIKCRADFDEFKKRLDPETASRHPADFEAFVKRCASREHPLGIAPGSFYGHTLQQWIGTENLCMLFYDDPDFIHYMLDYLEDFFVALIEPYVKRIDFDFASFGEDIAYKGRSFLSPEMFKRFIQPHYPRLTKMLVGNGIKTIFVDSDGFIDELVPLWMEVGINGFSPLEVAAGADALRLKKRYGKDIVLGGNVDKRALIAGKDEIDKEIEKVAEVLELGGFFPMVDHSVPPDVPLENFIYYFEKLKSLGQ